MPRFIEITGANGGDELYVNAELVLNVTVGSDPAGMAPLRVHIHFAGGDSTAMDIDDDGYAQVRKFLDGG
jgi:hypothetical protein